MIYPMLLMNTPLGWFWAVSNGSSLVASSLEPTQDLAIAMVTAFGEISDADDMLKELMIDMRRYTAGARVDFSRHPVDLSRQPPFRQQALLAARMIPYGEVRTYQWLAEQAGNPRTTRAAGQAMAHNPVSPVIPCHRVVASDLRLGGYGGGLGLKRALLTLEGVQIKGGRVDRRFAG